ncbi:MAG: vitamin K epoxide reductase family protein [Acidobacteriaceae bacterium]
MSRCDGSLPGESSNGLLLAATSAAILTLLPIAAHQLGLLEHLPDPPSCIFDSDTITSSKAAHPLGIPDGLLGVGSYGGTLVLGLLAQRNRRANVLLAGKLTADGAIAAFNVVKQVVAFRRLCSWCAGTALCTAAMVFAGRGLIRQEASKLRGRL